MSDPQQVNDLEVRIAYLEDTLDKLDAVVTRCADELASLTARHGATAKKLQALEEYLSNLDGKAGDEPPPPHY